MRAESASAAIDKAWANLRAPPEARDVRLHDCYTVSQASVRLAG
jgi:hypothetical protein